MEYEIFIDIRDKVKKYIPKLQMVAKAISEVDVLQSFALISEKYNYVRPNITDKHSLKIINSRHPVVERVIKDEYVENDIIMDEKTDILLITGPNMAGKSTYMRQCAITIIMAQIGSFVPCSSCTMPIFDKIFTRIGASDDLVSGESTFMVEMKEAEYAISEATNNSLILFDELGRGTATFDGMALAQAILEYVHDKIHAKTMFSTHYHELTSLDKKLKRLKNVHVSAIEEDGNITFLHKVQSGAVDRSYGIHVASLAGLPSSLIERSKEILNVYEKNSKKESKYTQTSLFDDAVLNSNNEEENEIEKEFESVNPLEMTPMEALTFIYNLKKKMKEKK